MRVNQLLEILHYIISIGEETDLLEELQVLTNYLNQARQSPSPDISNKLSSQRQEILQILEGSEPKDWPYTKRKLFNLINSKGLIGYQAIKRINDSFNKYQGDPFGVVQEISVMIQELTQMESKYNSVVDLFKPFLDQYTEEEITPGHTVLYLFFENNAILNTFKDLQNASKDWNINIRSFSRLASEPVQDVEIYSIEQGSIIFGLIAGIGTATALAKGINEILKVYERVLNIRKIQLETKKLKLDLSIQKIYEDEINKIIETASEKAAEKLIKEYLGDQLGGKGDIGNGISIALKKMFEFIEKGGKIDYQEVADEEKNVKAERLKLAESFNKIQELECDIKEIKSLLSKNPEK